VLCLSVFQGWQRVEAASHHVLSLQGRVAAKLNSLAQLEEARLKLMHQALCLSVCLSVYLSS
jgi:hypothetical protein